MQRYRYSVILLRELVVTDFKLRYQGSFLGYLWTLVKPLAIFIIMYTVFVRFLKFNFHVPHTAVYLFIGIVLWGFFTEVTTGCTTSIFGQGELLRSIHFPRYVIVMAVSINALINLLFNFVVVAIFMIVSKDAISLHILMALPLLLELYVLGLAIGFILATLYVRLRDVNYIWEVALQALFYAIPILYPIARVPEKWAKWLLLNPGAQIIQGARYYIVTTKSPTIDNYWSSPFIRLAPVMLVILIAIFAGLYFKKRSKYFAEEV